MLSPITLKFLEAVKFNNNTEWMHRNHDLYVQERKRFLSLIECLLADMQKIDSNLSDVVAKDCIYRFNRDLRFVPDKSQPYKLHFGACLCSGWRKSSLPCYYLHIQPWDCSMVWWWSRCPSKEEINRIRLYIWKHRDEWLEITENKSFKSYFWTVERKDDVMAERRMKTKAWKALLEQAWEVLARKIVNDKDMLEIFCYHGRVVDHHMTDEEILSDNGYSEVIDWFKKMKIFNDFLINCF
mgnify:CR=1 FL=1